MRSLLHLMCILPFIVLSVTAQTITAPTDTLELGAPFSIEIVSPADTNYTYAISKHETWVNFTQILSAKLTPKDSLIQIQFDVAVYQAPLCTLSLPTLTKTPKGDDTTLATQKDTLPFVVVQTHSVLNDSLVTLDSLSSAGLHTPLKAGKFPWHIIGSIGLALLILGGIGYLLWSKLHGREKREPVVPPMHPFDEAKAGLNNLRGRNYLQSREIKKYVFRLSEILKRYLGRSYKANIQESTSQEFLDWLKESDFERENRSAVEKFIAQTEPIKFADMGAPDNELKELFTLVETVIEQDHTSRIARETELEEKQ